MKVQWCWRCKMDLPMLDEDEFADIWARFEAASPDGRRELLDGYERLVLRLVVVALEDHAVTVEEDEITVAGAVPHGGHLLTGMENGELKNGK